MADAQRLPPLADRLFAGNGVSVMPLPTLERISLRADQNSLTALGKVLGVPLPLEPGTTQSNKGITALWIGPDEWLVLAKLGSGISDALNSAKRHSFSAVSIDHRNTGMVLSGPNVENALNGGCPRDLTLSAFPVGSCSRTILAKAEIILWRKGRQEFHLECWRSFSGYVWKFIVESSRSA